MNFPITGFNEATIDLDSVFAAEAKARDFPAPRVPVDPERPILRFCCESEFEVGQRLHLTIKMRDPELEIDFDAYVAALQNDREQRLVAVHPIGLHQELLNLIVNSLANHETQVA